jgi:release factor glutamine methyltransferase
MMSAKRAERLRRWHLEADRDLREGLPRRMLFLGLDIRIPLDVFAPSGSGRFHELVRDEVKPSDRVLDMGTGSGINALLAALTSSDVVAVDINPKAVEATAGNAARNGVADRITVAVSDLFDAVEGSFDVIAFNPPFRWFKARDLFELSTADEGYRALTSFMQQVRTRLRPGGRIILNFGTSGDIDYLYHLIERSGLRTEVLATEDVLAGDLVVTYYVFRLTA